MGTDAYEQAKYTATLAQVSGGPYRRIMEMGCSEGVFTQRLVRAHPDAHVTAVDISERALRRAAERVAEAADRTLLVSADLLTFTAEHRYDLVFCSETLYYVGRGDRLRQASAQLIGLLAPGGVLVLVHPWPEARRLHRFVDASGAVSRVSEFVETAAHRPFAVSVYRAPGWMNGSASV